MARHNGVNEPRKTDRRTFSAEGEIRVVLDDFSRRIPERQLQPSMDAEAFAEVVELACDETRVGRVPPNNRPHVLSDRGTALLSRSFGQYLQAKGLGRIFALPSHPRTDGKVECFPRWAKEQIVVVCASPGQVEHEIENFAALHSSMQYHEVLASVTPDDVYFARRAAILRRRDQLTTWMMRRCRRENRARKTRTAGSSAAPDFGPQDGHFC